MYNLSLFLGKGTLAVTPGDQSDNTEAAIADNILIEEAGRSEAADEVATPKTMNRSKA